METIEVYIQNLFEQLPKTPAVLEMKQQLLQSMEDKYEELIAAGKSQNEAIGVVIAEFGNIDELMEELGLGNNEATATGQPIVDKVVWNVAQVQDYLDAAQKFSKYIAIGVAMILLGVATLIVSSSTDRGIAVGMIVLFLCVSAAVGLMIYATGVRDKNPFDATEMLLSMEAKKYVDMYDKEQKQKAILPTAFGVILCILSALIIIVPALIIDITDGLSTILVGIMLVVIAVAVGILIIANNYKSAVDRLLGRGEFDQAVMVRNELFERFSGFYWILTTAIFLGYSFITEDWGRSWIIWPVASLLFAAISALFSSKKTE